MHLAPLETALRIPFWPFWHAEVFTVDDDRFDRRECRQVFGRQNEMPCQRFIRQLVADNVDVIVTPKNRPR
jgi:hypothetical protein